MGKWLPIVVSCAVAWSTPASAAILAHYNFESPTTVNAAGTGETNDAVPVSGVSVSTLDRGLNSNYFLKRDITSNIRVVSGAVDNHTWSIAGDITPTTFTVGTSNYLSFTLTPDPLTEIDLTQLTLRMGLGKTGGSGSHALNAFVYTSLDSFASQVGSTLSISGISSGSGEGPIWLNNILDVSGLGPITVPVTFRLYFTDGGSGLNSKHGLLDTLSIEGNVTAIPEPTTWAALSCILFTGVWFAGVRRKSG